MAEKTFEKCLQNILTDIKKRAAVNYGDKNSVRRYNAAYERLSSNFVQVDQMYPQRIHELMDYLDHKDFHVSETFALFIVKMQNAKYEQKKAALDTLQQLLSDSHVPNLNRFMLSKIIPGLEKVIYPQNNQ